MVGRQYAQLGKAARGVVRRCVDKMNVLTNNGQHIIVLPSTPIA